jgi:hypothetical protein
VLDLYGVLEKKKILDHTHTNTTRIYLAGMAREVQPLG